MAMGGGQKLILVGALIIFVITLLFFALAYGNLTNKTWLILGIYLFIGGLIVLIVGRFMG